jgi:AcrR family transcriptional regulator
VLHAAVQIADEHGVAALTMRRLAETVGAEAMSLYYHVANKNDLLDGIVDVLMAELNEAVDRLTVVTDWKAAMRHRILTARAVLLRHPWAPRLLESRTTMRPAVVIYHDRLVGLMRSGGFSYDLAHHALHALGSRALGFSQELFDPADASPNPDADARMLADLAEQVPNLAGMLAEVAHDDPDSTIGWCDDQQEFEFALDLILDGLARLAAR